MPTNTAAWLGAKGARLAVGPAPYTPPREGEIVVKNHAVAINPLDWIIQVAGSVAYRWLRYPCVLGADLAGEVVEVGAGVTRFTVGDRVLGHAVGTDKDRNTPAEGAFQEYTVLLAHMAAPIPDTMPYESAAVLPLALSTAACGLFQRDQLALHYPAATPQPTGQTLLVWGGATSVGSNAIQLAVAAGYAVVTTASPRNFDYVRELGASQVFDRRSTTVVREIIAAFAGKTLAGALAIGAGSAEPCADIVRACHGTRRIAIASTPVSFASGLTFQTFRKLISSTVALQVRCRIRRIRTTFIVGTTLKANEVGGDDLRGVPARGPRGGALCGRAGTLRHRHGTQARPGRVRHATGRGLRREGGRLLMMRVLGAVCRHIASIAALENREAVSAATHGGQRSI
jgi:NADPH:quinone reductase-like Zn-dependent oxidoreductase